MKRLYFLFLSILGTIVYSSEHSQEPSYSERRESFVAMLERRGSSIKKFFWGKKCKNRLNKKMQNHYPGAGHVLQAMGQSIIIKGR
jgi:hypothetical protein